MEDTQLEKIKRRLGITDNLQDELITDLIEDAESHFKLVTGTDEIRPKYDFIIRDVALKMYSRKGSEALESESVDGYSANYVQSLFDEYMPILERDFDLRDDDRKRGKVMFF